MRFSLILRNLVTLLWRGLMLRNRLLLAVLLLQLLLLMVGLLLLIAGMVTVNSR